MNFELAKEITEIPGWRWMNGMHRRRYAPGYLDNGQSQGRVTDSDLKPGEEDSQHGCVPDLGDPATAGCLLELLGAGVYFQGYLRSVSMGEPDSGEPYVYSRSLGVSCALMAQRLECWPG
jgi:hypothetical protein